MPSFIKIVQVVKKLNSISRERLNFRRRPFLCTPLYRNLLQASNFGGTFDQLFFWICLSNFHRRWLSTSSIPWCKNKYQKWPKTQIKGVLPYVNSACNVLGLFVYDWFGGGGGDVFVEDPERRWHDGTGGLHGTTMSVATIPELFTNSLEREIDFFLQWMKKKAGDHGRKNVRWRKGHTVLLRNVTEKIRPDREKTSVNHTSVLARALSCDKLFQRQRLRHS